MFYPNLTESLYSNHWFVPTILCYYLFAPIYWQILLRWDNKTHCTVIFVFFILSLQVVIGPAIPRDIICLFNRLQIFIPGFHYRSFLGTCSSPQKVDVNIISVLILLLSSFLIIICDKFAVRIRSINPIDLIQLAVIPILLQVLCSYFERLDSTAVGHMLILFLNKTGKMSLPIYLFGSVLQSQIRSLRMPLHQKEFGLFLVTVITACDLQDSFGSLHRINYLNV